MQFCKFYSSIKIRDAVHYGGGKNMSESTRVDNVKTYGPYAVIAGLALSAGLIWFMFALADGFS